MEYFAVYENIELGDSFGTVEQNRVSDAFVTFHQCFECFFEMGGMTKDSNLTIETLHEITPEEEMLC